MLDSLRDEINSRDNNIETLYNHLKRIESEIKIKNKNIIIPQDNIIHISEDLDALSNILKASIFLMIYNKFEFFVREFILTLYEGIIESEVSFFELKDELQESIAELLFHKNLNKGEKKKQLHQVFMDDKMNYCPHKKQIVNGNVDKKKLKEILSNYKIPVKVCFNSAITLDTLKDLRNALAHGEKNFYEQGISYTVDNIEIFKEDIKSICYEMLDELDIYLNDKKFVKS